MPSICRNIVFLSHFLEVQTYNLFYLDLLYLDNQQFLGILFDLFFLSNVFLATYFVWWFRLFQDLLEYSFEKNMVFLPSFCSWIFIFKVFWINFCSDKMPSICRNIMFLSHFLEVQTYNLFYLDLLYLDNQQILAILFIFLSNIFFR